MRGVEVRERRGDRVDGPDPGRDVVPDVGVPVPLELLGLKQELWVEQLGHRVARDTRAAHLGEAVRHAALEHQPRIEDDVRLGEGRKVVAVRLVEVRVDARTHQALDLGVLARDLAHDVGHHRAGGHRAVGGGVGRRAGFAAGVRTAAGGERAGQGDCNGGEESPPEGREAVRAAVHGRD